MSVPPLLRLLFDDAAVFPPGNLPLAEAVPAHRAHRVARYADAVGPFLCGAGRLAELAAAAGPADGPALRVGLVLPGGSASLAEALAAAAPFEIAAVELVSADLPKTVAVLDERLPAGTTAYVELPRDSRVEDALDVLAGTPYRAKFRTGGLTAEAFPGVYELAGSLMACAERAVPYKCTAGLHNAVRHTDPVTGFEHHGFLNVLLAALAARAGDRTGTADALRERSGEVLAGAARALSDDQVTLIRESFTSFGTCSIAEPLADLADLGLPATTLTPHLEDR
ncbi:hypothetical protein [Kitasatospora sp. NBC_00315]|uniref:hypothetical protein n=1 Tax=Kitasatospora sp. NBC_00315 TaxID=2975963 RepID=UPI003245CBAF